MKNLFYILFGSAILLLLCFAALIVFVYKPFTVAHCSSVLITTLLCATALAGLFGVLLYMVYAQEFKIRKSKHDLTLKKEYDEFRRELSERKEKNNKTDNPPIQLIHVQTKH